MCRAAAQPPGGAGGAAREGRQVSRRARRVPVQGRRRAWCCTSARPRAFARAWPATSSRRPTCWPRRGPEIDRMIADLVADVDYLECDSEVDALLRESRLIKDIQPRFNARLKDDKSFPYLQITTGEDFPRVSITRQPTADGRQALRPVRLASADLRAALPLHAAGLQVPHVQPGHSTTTTNARRFFRPCILHAIKQCTAPCAAQVSRRTTPSRSRDLRQFLESKGTQSSARLTRADEARRPPQLDFERAAGLRDELRALEGLQKRGLVDEHVQPEVFFVDPPEGLLRLARGAGLPAAAADHRGHRHRPPGRRGDRAGRWSASSTAGPSRAATGGTASRPSRAATTTSPASARWSGGGTSYAGMDAGAVPRRHPHRRRQGPALGRLTRPSTTWSSARRMLLAPGQEGRGDLHPRPGRARSACRGNDPALRLLQAVRDEAHRFAQHYHHILRRKKLLGQDSPPKPRPRRQDQPPEIVD